jgi:ribonuclease H / adenosylcobalamin/alpha-ribazole phosphatase
VRLVILRHGESVSNAHPERVALPEAEGDRLTAKGREQADAAGRWLADRHFDRLVSSPMGRARETAEIVARHTGHEIELDDEIHELRESEGFGELPPEEQKLRRWSVWMAEHGDDPDHSPPGGESFNAVLGRVAGFKRRLGAGPPGQTVLAVSHGIFARFFLMHSILEESFRAADVHRLWHLRTVNCGISVFDDGERRHPADPELAGWYCSMWMATADEAAALLPRLRDPA